MGHQGPRPAVICGYARVSSTDQDLPLQIDKLKAAGCTIIRPEEVWGTSPHGRSVLDALLALLREGDTLMVTRVDRLARSIGGLQDIVRAIRSSGAILKATD